MWRLAFDRLPIIGSDPFSGAAFGGRPVPNRESQLAQLVGGGICDGALELRAANSLDIRRTESAAVHLTCKHKLSLATRLVGLAEQMV